MCFFGEVVLYEHGLVPGPSYKPHVNTHSTHRQYGEAPLTDAQWHLMHGGITREHDWFLSLLVDTTDHLTPLVDTTAHRIQTVQDVHFMVVCACWTRTHLRDHVANDPLEGRFLVVPHGHDELRSLYIA